MTDSNNVDNKNEQLQVNHSHKSPKFLYLTIVAIVVTLLVFAGLVYAFLQFRSNNNVAEDPCGGAILDEASSVLNPVDYSRQVELEAVSNQIREIENYESYPNCLYPLLQNYVFVGDLTNAIETFNSFESAVDAGGTFSEESFAINVESLRDLVAGLEKARTELNQGSGAWGFGETTDTVEDESTE